MLQQNQYDERTIENANLLEDGEVVVLRDAEEVDDEERNEKESDLKIKLSWGIIRESDREDKSNDDGAEVVDNLEFLLTHAAEIWLEINK